MHRTAVQSSNIASVGYDRTSEVLEIAFHHGGIFRYPGTSAAEYAALMVSESKGKYLHQHFVQAGREYEPVEDEEATAGGQDA